MTAIAIQGLTKRLGQFQLDIPEFTLEEGCVAGFVGRNGAGKTTTMKLMMHMIFPDNGKIELLGLDVAKDGCNIREQLGYVGETMGFLDQDVYKRQPLIIGQISGSRSVIKAKDFSLQFLLLPFFFIGDKNIFNASMFINSIFTEGPFARCGIFT